MAQDLRPASSTSVDILDAGDGFIEHRVSKLDTLAGVAIKYGVEVADVKRLNGLVSDFQMFAHKTLRIPAGRRHPTFICAEYSSLSECPVSAGGQPPKSNTQQKMLNNHEKRVRDDGSLSLAMNLPQGYHGLPLPAQQADGNETGTETVPFKAEAVENLDDEPFSCRADVSIMGLKNSYNSSNGVDVRDSVGRKADGLLTSAGHGQMSHAEVLQTAMVGAADGSSNERSVRRRFKTEAAAISPPAIDDDSESKPGACAFDKLLPTSGLLRATAESSDALAMVILKVLDGALVGSSRKGKDSPVRAKKCPSTSSLQDPTSTIAEVKQGSQYSSRMSTDSYRFKVAID